MATLTAQQIVTSLVGACLLLGVARETAQRQLTAEKSKKGCSEVCLNLQSAQSPMPGARCQWHRDLETRAGTSLLAP